MNDLVSLLKDAFDAGKTCASAYEMGGYAPDFKKWAEENKEEIELLHKQLMLSDGHRQYRKNDDNVIHSNHGDRHSGFSV